MFTEGRGTTSDLSRVQFALTALPHILRPVLPIGLSFFIVAREALRLKTGNVDGYRYARFRADGRGRLVALGRRTINSILATALPYIVQYSDVALFGVLFAESL